MQTAKSFLFVALSLIPGLARAGGEPDKRFAFFAYLTAQPSPRMITYTPSQLDPRFEANQRKLATSSIRADLAVLRPVFDGLILYGYHEATTPRILAVAKDLKFRALLLGIWDPRSAAEVDGVAKLVRLHEKDFALGVLVGNEGITFKRYELEDLSIAEARVRRKLPKGIPVSTSEPQAGYESQRVLAFGDFLAPNIHPVFHRSDLPPVAAAAWTREQAVQLARRGKRPVLLKETGFPHGGKAAYHPASQKAFWTAYRKPGGLVRLREAPDTWIFFGVAFEAFDLPWKTEESKLAVEKAWGLFSADRKPYPALSAWQATGAGPDGGVRQ